MTVPYIFKTAVGTIPLAQLDDNFAAVVDTTSLASATGATSVGFSPTGTIVATTVQTAIAETNTDLIAGLALKTNITDLAATSGASLVGFNPTGTISSTTVQTAIAEINTDLAASTGASLVGFIGPGTGAVARTVDAKLKETVSVFDFMTNAEIADVKASTLLIDVTVALQTAINASSHKKLLFPAGYYKITSTLTVTNYDVAIVGETAGNNLGSVIFNYGSGDAIYFYNPSVKLGSNSIQHMAIRQATDTPTGAGIKIQWNDGFYLADCCVMEHYIGYHLIGVTSSLFSDLKASTGYMNTLPFSGATGSSHLLIEPLPTYSAPDFVGAGWINTFSGIRFSSSFKTEYGINVRSGDSNLFTTGYIGGCDIANIHIKIALAAPLNSTHFNNLYLDGVSFDPAIQTTYGAYINTDASTAKVIDVEFNNCTIGQPGTGITVTESVPNLVISGCSIFNTSGAGISIMNADVSGTITGNSFWNCGRLTNASSAVYVGYAKSLSITGNNFNECNGATNVYGIRLDSTATLSSVAISGNSFNAGDIDYLNLATITNCALTGNSSSNVASSVITYLESNIAGSVALQFGGASTGITYTGKTAKCIKNQNVVNYTIYIQLSSKGSATGVARLTGLPYSPDSSYPTTSSVRLAAMTSGVGDTMLGGVVGADTTNIQLFKQISGSSQQLTDVDFTNTSIIEVSGFYFT